MAGERLFGTNISPACKYCERVYHLLDEGKMLCDKRGVVLSTNKCHHFIYDPLKRIPKKPKALAIMSEAEFEL